jgi:hypothetical protein
MISWNGLVSCVGVAVLISAAGSLLLHKLWQQRYRALKQELKQFSEDLMQMAELQSDIYHRVSRHLNDIEAKVLDLSVPASEGALPLERRHQVLTLARNGVAVEEIAQRLGMPKGEVDLILSVRKFAKATPPPERLEGAIREYARASS